MRCFGAPGQAVQYAGTAIQLANINRGPAAVPLLQLQAAAGQQAEALVAMAARMETLEKEIRDTGGPSIGVCVCTRPVCALGLGVHLHPCHWNPGKGCLLSRAIQQAPGCSGAVSQVH